MNYEEEDGPSIEGDDYEEEPLSVERRPADEESNNKDNWKGRFEQKSHPAFPTRNTEMVRFGILVFCPSDNT